MAAPASPPFELTERDRAVLRDLDRVRLLTGAQLERLHFWQLANQRARGSARRRTLGRLIRLQLVTTLPRRVGGDRAGSAGLVYALDARAYRLERCWHREVTAVTATRLTGRIRRPWAIGWPFVAHTLDIAELYVRYIEQARHSGLRLLRFDAEPVCWFTTKDGVLKPDAYLVYSTPGWEEHRWLEVDRATESLPTVRRKFMSYVTLLRSASSGPAGILPSIVMTVPTERRLQQVERLVTSLDVPDGFIRVVIFNDLPATECRPPP